MIALMKKPNTHGIKHILYDTLNMIQVKPKKIAEWICKENLSNRNYATLHYFQAWNKIDWMLDAPEEEIQRDEESDCHDERYNGSPSTHCMIGITFTNKNSLEANNDA